MWDSCWRLVKSKGRPPLASEVILLFRSAGVCCPFPKCARHINALRGEIIFSHQILYMSVMNFCLDFFFLLFFFLVFEKSNPSVSFIWEPHV